MTPTLPITRPGLQVRYHTGWRRQINEDWIDWRHREGEASVCVLCDGLGGFRHGAEAARRAARTFIDEVLPPSASMAQQGLHPARIKLALRRGVALLQEEVGDRRVATTLTGIVLMDNLAWLFHIGDSKAYLVRGHGLMLLSEDHSVGGGAQYMLQRALGHPEREDLDVRPLVLEKGDRILLCSDGLQQAGLGDDRIGSIVADGLDDKTIADRLLNEALAGSAPDNISLVLIDCGVWR